MISPRTTALGLISIAMCGAAFACAAALDHGILPVAVVAFVLTVLLGAVVASAIVGVEEESEA